MHAEGSTAEQMKLKAADLEGKREWSKLGFRGLTPVAPDSKDMGLRLKINFDLDSYELTQTAQQHLDELGEELAVSESIRISLQAIRICMERPLITRICPSAVPRALRIIW